MPISSNFFSDPCAVSLGTDIARCGATTICDIARANADDLQAIFQDDTGRWRNMLSLMVADMEGKACGINVNPWYEFFMANKRMKTITKVPVEGPYGGQPRWEVQPFVLMDSKSIFNNAYWNFTGGTDPGGTPDWQIDATSTAGVPLDDRWFQAGDRLFLHSRTDSGVTSHTAYVVISSAVVGSAIRIQLAAENTTYGPSAKVTPPETGFFEAGNANVSNWDNRCAQIPGVNRNKRQEFWVETFRRTLCRNQSTDRYIAELLAGNPLFRDFGDVSINELNKQIVEDYQRKQVSNWLWEKRINANQTINTWTDLPNITSISTNDLYLPGEGVCVGKRANQVGIVEQMYRCNRWRDLENETMNLNQLFEDINRLSRARGDQGGNGKVIEVWTNQVFRRQFQRAMVRYFDNEYEGLMRFNFSPNQTSKNGLGWNYDEYLLTYPAGVTLHVISDKVFDDYRTQAISAGQGNAGNLFAMWDMSVIYPIILGSKRVVHSSGTAKELARVDANFLCTMENLTQEVTMDSMTNGMVVECPLNSLTYEGFNDEVPDHLTTGVAGAYYSDYPGEP